jgi:adenine-specific DNA-methyltransferase
MQKFENKLIDLLKSLPKFIDEKTGNILRNEVVNSALKIDKELISLLIKDKEIKEKFFTEISGYWIFEINKFVDYVQDKEFLDDTYTKFKNKIGLTIDNKFIRERREVALSFPFKDCILEGDMTKEDEKRNEIFFNEVLAQDQINRLLDPKVLTNFKRYSAKGEESVTEFKRDKEGVIKENLIIKGNNLLALYSLKEQFQGKIKLIYIDPPYNIGNDSFKYNDSFNHSTWLTFMKNRLEIARDLLSNDGAIFVSINHIELGYILILMDEIFGRENKLPIITLRSGTTASYRSINETPVNVSEFVIAYRKTPAYKNNQIFIETSYTEDYSHIIENNEDKPHNWKLQNLNDFIYKKEGYKNKQEFIKKYGDSWQKFRFEQKEIYALAHPEKIISLNTLQKPSEKILQIINLSKKERDKVHIVERNGKDPIYCYNGRTLAFFSSKFRDIGSRKVPSEILTNIWGDVSFLGIGSEGGVELHNGKKPELLVKHIIDLATKEGDIILDFFLGVGTTCAVAHKMNRQYIGIEQLDYNENDTITRLKNVINNDQTGISKIINWKGGGDFIYCELMKFNEKAIEIINNVQDTHELLKIWGEMCEKYFLDYNVEVKKFNDNVEEFKELQIGDQKKVLIEMLNKNQLYVNLSEINDLDFKVSKEDKELNKKFYSD